MLTPRSESEAIDIIRAASAAGTTLEIVGGGTRRGLGNLVETQEKLSSSALTGIAAYNPAEMVMTARAGTPLSIITAALDENRHMLAFEPPDYRGIYGSEGEPTIGGLFAGNFSGPRRFQSGAARDHLLGVRFINGFGEAVSAGGRVMKNVTGLDLVKLMAGSFGTLGFMTELTFKVLPRPETAVTVVLSGLHDEDASWAMSHALSKSVEVTGAAYLPESCKWQFLASQLPEGPATLLRLEGLAFSVEERLARLKSAFPSATLSVLDKDESATLWQEIRDVKPFFADGRPRPLWKVSVAPNAGHQLLSALRMQTGVDGYYDWQGGLLWLRMEAEPEADMLRAGIKHFGGGHATLMRATDDQRRSIAVFEPQAPAVAALSARIREKFDPAGIFNPGRMG
ncbi:glycolate oxidase subunit GlcE [Rhizobium sp. KVB221]|uniref:Glycolate oxidase subunit GlcE n=1 Tax=Rhizobium setariae TaxID=2801340 RepID=A0A936YQL4_9HYPH|nr:glycolate oxidase subunit GlcE [Rhizobium setariae]MBL0370560.1 glycolate oxidase subunit GlcE [Rhizobium setariae]